MIRERTTLVGAGENDGHQLVEYRLVRDVMALNALTPRLALPLVPEHRGVVLLIQDGSWHVVGAAELPGPKRCGSAGGPRSDSDDAAIVRFSGSCGSADRGDH